MTWAAAVSAVTPIEKLLRYARQEDWSFTWVVDKTPKLFQKIMHVLLYAGLSSLVFWTIEPLTAHLSYRAVVAFLITVGFGAFNEWRQLQIPSRFGTITDVMLNAVGAVFGLLIVVLV